MVLFFICCLQGKLFFSLPNLIDMLMMIEYIAVVKQDVIKIVIAIGDPSILLSSCTTMRNKKK